LSARGSGGEESSGGGDAGKPVLPRGALAWNTFNLFNAVAFTVMMGAPIVLFAKSLGASSTVLGIISAFTPLLVVFQIPAARFLPIYGYKRFMMAGWGLRNLFIGMIAFVPLLGFLDDFSRLAILLALLFCFNLLRGISSCAALPWMTHIIPRQVRGRFLARDSLFIQVGCLLSLLVSSFLMQGKQTALDFTLVFGLAAVGQIVSLFFMRLIPDADPGEESKRSAERVPWTAMMTYGPFARLLVFNLLWFAAIGGLTVFSVEFMEGLPGFDSSVILFLSSLAFVAAMISVPFTSSLVDRTSARSLLRVGVFFVLLAVGGWFLLATETVPPSRGFVAMLTMLTGFGGTVFNVTNARIMMATMPEMGRNHFFALYSVVTSLGLATSPVAWGMMLDALAGYEFAGAVFVWKPHAVYFLAVAGILLLVALLARILKEGRQMEQDESLLLARLNRLSRPFPR